MHSIVTASLRQLPWLKRCARSVADQGVACEHLIQDGGTGPELEQWVRGQTEAELVVEPDTGVYDALNRGLHRARGETLSFLHSDEQYLPGALGAVAQAFAAPSAPDLVVGDYLVLREDGTLGSYHRATPLRASMVQTDHLYDYTCALFFRRALWERSGGFDPSFRTIADADWMARLLSLRPRISYLHGFTSAFFLTGENLSLHTGVRAEEQRLRQKASPLARKTAPLLRAWRRGEKLLHGGYTTQNLQYAVFLGDDAYRTAFHVARPSSRHPWAGR